MPQYEQNVYCAKRPPIRPNNPKPYKEVLIMILTTEQVQEMYTHYQQHGLEATAKAFGRRKHNMQEIFERRGLLPREVTPKRERQYHFADKLTDEQRDYIKGHYKKAKRSAIAKRVGIRDKRVFNFICLELGLSS